MSTQLIGFSIGGVGKRFLVSPPSMSELFIDQIIEVYCSDVAVVSSSLAGEFGSMRAFQYAALTELRWYG